MLRGINKHIIEISDTGSSYFEKVLFFVKSENADSTVKLEEEARRIMLSYFTEGSDGYKEGFLRYTDNEKLKKRKRALFGVFGVVFVIGAFVLTYILI